jgi:hypothetical protein
MKADRALAGLIVVATVCWLAVVWAVRELLELAS